jgi:hypothetical protein
MTIWEAYRRLFQTAAKHVPSLPPNMNLDLVFAVADNEPWWLAVLQTLDEAERETVAGARNRTGNPNLCIAAVGAGEGIDLVRNKLIDKRYRALRKKGGSNAIHESRPEQV